MILQDNGACPETSRATTWYHNNRTSQVCPTAIASQGRSRVGTSWTRSLALMPYCFQQKCLRQKQSVGRSHETFAQVYRRPSEFLGRFRTHCEVVLNRLASIVLAAKEHFEVAIIRAEVKIRTHLAARARFNGALVTAGVSVKICLSVYFPSPVRRDVDKVPP